jgi:hypothetical protein
MMAEGKSVVAYSWGKKKEWINNGYKRTFKDGRNVLF